MLTPNPPEGRSWFLFSPGSLRTHWYCFLGSPGISFPILLKAWSLQNGWLTSILSS